MAERTKVTVWIGGKEFQVAGTVPEAYIHKIAAMVDRKNGELQAMYPHLTTAQINTLTSVRLAEEVYRLQESQQDRKDESQELQLRNRQLEQENAELRIRLKELEQELAGLKLEKNDLMEGRVGRSSARKSIS